MPGITDALGILSQSCIRDAAVHYCNIGESQTDSPRNKISSILCLDPNL